MSRCKWNIKSSITDKARKLSSELSISPVFSQIMINRGYSNKEDIEAYLNPLLSKLPDPFILSDMEKAANRVADAVIKKEKVCVYGDYDIDGSTAIASLTGFLRSFGLEVIYYQPERFGDGYGFHKEAVDRISSQGVTLLITVDCGTTNLEAAQYCRDKGMDLIITDHHKVGSEMPEAFAFVNPHKPGEEKIFEHLAGVGVAYYLMIGTRRALMEKGHFNEDKVPDLKEYLDVVAFGTIADVVPVQGINRILVKRGLELLNKSPRVGLSALVDISGLKNKINSDSVSFILSPRMNAAGRMGSASRCVDLLLTKDVDEAERLAKVLQDENNKRMGFQKESWSEVQAMVDSIKAKDIDAFSKRLTITLKSNDWHQGIIGIVASKAVDRWFKPTAVFTSSSDGLLKGSARSIPGINIYDVFSGFRDLFEDFGGHDMAAGMSIRAERIDNFEKLFEEGVRNSCPDPESLIQCLEVDLEVKSSDLGLRVVNELSMMEPFGIDNPAPLFFSSAKVFNKWVLKEKHLKLKLDNGIDAIGFNMAELADSIGSKVDMVFRPSINEWNGSRQIQYILSDID